ncbi:MAG: hypothetical protein ACI843_000491 [Psychrobacter glaciei]|jgi:hypothetical protein
MNKLKVLGVLLTLALVTTKAMALTTAGTSINNTATVNYNVGASSLSATSTQVTIKVQELINATLESKNAGKQQTVAPGQSNAALSFELTNTGNGDEAFVLTQQNLTGDLFDTIADNIYVDDGDSIFEPLIDAIYVPTSLAPEESIALWIASKDISNTQNNGDDADILVNALSKTFSDAGNSNPAQGDTVIGQGDDSTDAIHAISGPANDTATFIIDNSAINMIIEKSINGVRDGITTAGNQYIPNAEVDYLVTVEVTGTGDATAVTVSDPLPIELKLKNESTGTITLNDNGVITVMTANIPDNDGASYDANTRTITVELGDITAGDPIKNITFTTVIQ